MNSAIQHHVDSIDKGCKWDLAMQTVTLQVTARDGLGEPTQIALSEHSIDVLASLLQEVRRSLLDSMPKEREAFGELSLGDALALPRN